MLYLLIVPLSIPVTAKRGVCTEGARIAERTPNVGTILMEGLVKSRKSYFQQSVRVRRIDKKWPSPIDEVCRPQKQL